MYNIAHNPSLNNFLFVDKTNKDKLVMKLSDAVTISIRVITKLPNSEQSYKGKVKTHKYINRQNQSTTENCEHRNDPDLVQAFLKKW
jgi:hypothetical protein